MPTKLKWTRHEDLAIVKKPTVGRQEYLDHMTFRTNKRPLFTEIFGPIVGLKEEWEEQGATPEELDMSAFRYRCESRGRVPVRLGPMSGITPLDNYRFYVDKAREIMERCANSLQ